MIMIEKDSIEEILNALDRQIQVFHGSPIGLVICGGTALAALGLITRTTRDVDVLARASMIDGDIQVQEMEQFPDWLQSAAAQVGRDFSLPSNWLNLDPASQVSSGLPTGLTSRLVREEYGSFLTAFFLDRLDQIFFKLYAAVDGGRGDRHVQDLLALKPQIDEIEAATDWVLTQDGSGGFRSILKDFLEQHNYESAAKHI